MSLDYQIHTLKGRVEASADLHWYGAHGYFKVTVLGFGPSKDRAIEHAEDMAGRARVALQIATLELNRVLDITENVSSP